MTRVVAIGRRADEPAVDGMPIVRAGARDEALRHLEDLDPVGMGSAIPVCAEQVAKLAAPDAANVSPERHKTLEIARKLVLKALQSPRAETRKAAFEPMIAAFGTDLVVIRSPDDYELQPELRRIFEDMAQNDPDSELRERASYFLDPERLDRKVERILRWRERHEERGNQSEKVP